MQKPPEFDLLQNEVLTLPELAAFLRITEAAAKDLVAEKPFLGQKIGGDWRFLKRAVVDWLAPPQSNGHEDRHQSPSSPSDLFWEKLVSMIDTQIASRLPAPATDAPKRGSKEAVMKHFGIFKDDEDKEQQRVQLRAYRQEFK